MLPLILVPIIYCCDWLKKKFQIRKIDYNEEYSKYCYEDLVELHNDNSKIIQILDYEIEKKRETQLTIKNFILDLGDGKINQKNLHARNSINYKSTDTSILDITENLISQDDKSSITDSEIHKYDSQDSVYIDCRTEYSDMSYIHDRLKRKISELKTKLREQSEKIKQKEALSKDLDNSLQKLIKEFSPKEISHLLIKAHQNNKNEIISLIKERLDQCDTKYHTDNIVAGDLLPIYSKNKEDKKQTYGSPINKKLSDNIGEKTLNYDNTPNSKLNNPESLLANNKYMNDKKILNVIQGASEISSKNIESNAIKEVGSVDEGGFVEYEV